jgi:hypothetical protein
MHFVGVVKSYLKDNEETFKMGVGMCVIALTVLHPNPHS